MAALKRQLVWGNPVLFGDRTDGTAGRPCGNRSGWDVAHDDAACPDDRAFSNGDAAADHCVGADPDI